MVKAKSKDVWTQSHVYSLAPDDASITAAREVLRKGGFGTVEPTGDGRGWWVVCRGITDTYQVSARLEKGRAGTFDCQCTCPSRKYPCKHALALLLYLLDHSELRTQAEAPRAAASDFEGLLRAVFRDPDDDTPRLVFADFLEENDQADRAALIRYQCEQARLKPQTKRSRELRELIEPLVAKFGKPLVPLPEGITRAEFRRGFLHLAVDLYMVANVDALPVRFTNLLRDGWVELVDFSETSWSWEVEADDLDSLLARVGAVDVSGEFRSESALVALVTGTADARANGRLARIKVHTRNQKAFEQLLKVERGETDAGPPGARDLQRSYNGLTPQSFDLLLRIGRFSGASGLALNAPLGDAELAGLLTADLSGLQSLQLQGWSLTRTSLKALAKSPAPAPLLTLDLTACALGSGSVGVLTTATAFPEVSALTLSRCGLTDADVEALARSRSFPKLDSLDLSGNRSVTVRSARALLASKHFPRLDLNLSDTAVAQAQRIPLVLDAPDRPKLTAEFSTINVQRTIEGGEVIVAIESEEGTAYNSLFDNFAACAGAKRVTQFTAPRVAGRAVAALARGFDPQKLWRLDLSDTPLGNKGTTELLTAFAHFKLRELILRECRVGAVGVRALINSPLLASVRSLDLEDNDIGAAGAAALTVADVPPALEELKLTDFGFYTWEKRQLRTKFGARLKW
jgi:uncharacterized protein (TIGR02996 family)